MRVRSVGLTFWAADGIFLASGRLVHLDPTTSLETLPTLDHADANKPSAATATADKTAANHDC
jgi:hypothetical protein